MTTLTGPIKLDMLHSHKLVTLLLDPDKGFTAKRLTLDAYASFACEELGFAVTKNQVQTRVREFDIPAGDRPETTDEHAMASMLLSHESEINDLKERITRLEGWVNTTFPSKSPLKVVG